MLIVDDHQVNLEWECPKCEDRDPPYYVSEVDFTTYYRNNPRGLVIDWDDFECISKHSYLVCRKCGHKVGYDDNYDIDELGIIVHI